MNEKYHELNDAKEKRNDILARLSGRPDEEKSFDRDDRLGLKKYGENIQKIIRRNMSLPRSNDNCSFVIGIDGPWGSGKTTFLSMLYSEFVKDAGHIDEAVLPIYYNAWTGDFWNNAFAPFFDCIWNSIPRWKDAFKLEDIVEKWHIEPTIFEEAAFDIAIDRDEKSVKNISANGIRGAMWTLAACLTKPSTVLLDSEFRKKADAALCAVYSEVMRKEMETEDFFSEYSAFQVSIFVLQEFLAELTGEHLEEGETKEKTETIDKRTVAIFVDELDRCRPDFAVQTLEIIKHLFNVERVVFVIAMDISQLSHTVKSVYGEGFDSVGYLERFFNVMTILPQGTQFSYENILCEVQNEIMETEEKGRPDKSDDFEIFYEKYKWDKIKTDFSFVAKSFGLSLREFRRILLNMHLLETTELEPYLEYQTARVLYFYCLAIKYKFPLEFAHAVFKGEAKGLDQQLSAHQLDGMPFLKIIRSMLVAGANNRIESLSYQRMYRTHGVTTSQEWGFSNSASWVDDDGAYENDVCYSYVLYPPDRKDKEAIREYTLMEYLYRKIEMFDMDIVGRVSDSPTLSETK